jgi:lysophospholipase L1-like esterase
VPDFAPRSTTRHVGVGAPSRRVRTVVGVGEEEDLRFVALGDSTTVGVGDPVAGGGWRGWARLLADELAVGHRLTFTNLAVTGATAASVRELQLPGAVQARPHLASLVVGVNDTMRSTWDPGRLRDDVLACVSALTEAGAVVLSARFHNHGEVFGLPPVLRRPLWRRIEAVNEAYDAAHVLFGGLRVDLTAEPVVYQRRFWSVDRLHPGELGHRRLAHEFAAGLQALGYPLARPALAEDGGEGPSAWRDLMWMITAGAPWLGRRARDLGPWAARLAVSETAARLRARADAA